MDDGLPSWQQLVASRRGTLVRVRRTRLPTLCPMRYSDPARHAAVLALDARSRAAAAARLPNAKRRRPSLRPAPSHGGSAAAAAARDQRRRAPAATQAPAVLMGGAARQAANDALHCEIAAWDPTLLGERDAAASARSLGAARRIPVRFSNAAEYIAAFEPLLLREMRSEVAESVARARRGARGDLLTVEQQQTRRGLAPSLIVLVCSSTSRGRHGPRRGDLVLLSPPPSAASASVSGGGSSSRSSRRGGRERDASSSSAALAFCIAPHTFKLNAERWQSLAVACTAAAEAEKARASGGRSSGGAAQRSAKNLCVVAQSLGGFVTAERQHQALTMVDSFAAADALMGLLPPPPPPDAALTTARVDGEFDAAPGDADDAAAHALLSWLVRPLGEGIAEYVCSVSTFTVCAKLGFPTHSLFFQCVF